MAFERAILCAQGGRRGATEGCKGVGGGGMVGLRGVIVAVPRHEHPLLLPNMRAAPAPAPASSCVLFSVLY